MSVSKKIRLVLMAVMMTLSVSVFAWTPVQLSVWDGVKNIPNSKVVNGVKFGIPFSSDYWRTNQKVNGLELSFLSESSGINGVLMAGVNLNSRNSNGLQLCGANVSQNFGGLQIAAYNEASKHSEGAQLGGVNIAEFNSNIFQIGGINNSDSRVEGTQVGIINVSSQFKGNQIGLINTNYKMSSSCFQIGLLNYNENGFFTVFPFFNYSVR
ncbi:MAG: hypothetical protein K9L78_02785 [Victivallales bacterium]|nr:hypothetical protein [Victivallales bacterium]MCF7889022.1 hypothetical protein [Victivallales bacterium]